MKLAITRDTTKYLINHNWQSFSGKAFSRGSREESHTQAYNLHNLICHWWHYYMKFIFSQASPSDGLPPIVCSSCREQLDSCHRFRRVAHQTHQVLVDYLQFTSKLNGTPQVSWTHFWGFLKLKMKFQNSNKNLEYMCVAVTRSNNIIQKRRIQKCNIYIHLHIRLSPIAVDKWIQCKQFVCLLCNWIVTNIFSLTRNRECNHYRDFLHTAPDDSLKVY
jgi:hypothetical protein